MNNVYGTLVADGKWSMGACNIDLRVEDDLLRYRRECPFGKYEGLLKGLDSIVIHPAPPLYLPIPGLFTHVYIPIKPQLYIYPDETIKTTVDVTPDIAVSPESRGYRYIDVFPVSTPKMAVYGGSADGILSRYLYIYLGDGYPCLSIPIEISNEDGEAVTLSKIVIPIGFLDIYYREGDNYAVTNTIKVYIKAGVAEVSKGGFEGDNMKPIPIETEESLTERLGLDLSMVKKFLTVNNVFLMDRGL